MQLGSHSGAKRRPYHSYVLLAATWLQPNIDAPVKSEAMKIKQVLREKVSAESTYRDLFFCSAWAINTFRD